MIMIVGTRAGGDRPARRVPGIAPTTPAVLPKYMPLRILYAYAND